MRRGASSPRSAATNGGGGSGIASPPGGATAAVTPESTSANGHPSAVGERAVGGRPIADHHPSGPEPIVDQRDRRRLGLARDLRRDPGRGGDRGDERAGAGQQAARVSGRWRPCWWRRSTRPPAPPGRCGRGRRSRSRGGSRRRRRRPAPRAPLPTRTRRVPRSHPGPALASTRVPGANFLARSVAAAIALGEHLVGRRPRTRGAAASRRRHRPACSSCSTGTRRAAPTRAGPARPRPPGAMTSSPRHSTPSRSRQTTGDSVPVSLTWARRACARAPGGSPRCAAASRPRA